MSAVLEAAPREGREGLGRYSAYYLFLGALLRLTDALWRSIESRQLANTA